MSRRFLAVLALALLVVLGLGCEAPPSVIVFLTNMALPPRAALPTTRPRRRCSIVVSSSVAVQLEPAAPVQPRTTITVSCEIWARPTVSVPGGTVTPAGLVLDT